MSNSYFYWLLERLPDQEMVEDYKTALHILFNEDFVPKVRLDENRAGDVRSYLRDACPFAPSLIEKPASMLEVLMAVPMRLCEMSGEEFNGVLLPTWDEIFWDSLYNLGVINEFDDRAFEYARHDLNDDGDPREDLPGKLHDIVQATLWRTYGDDGIGGPYPLTNRGAEQKNYDLWQMINIYIGEKVDFSLSGSN